MIPFARRHETLADARTRAEELEARAADLRARAAAAETRAAAAARHAVDEEALRRAATATRAAEAAHRAAARTIEAWARVDALRDALIAPQTRRDSVAMLGGNVPIVLLPVRLETRYVGDELLVRVYPDDALHVDTHEPDLTADELAWGRRFVEDSWRAADDLERQKVAWAQLADRLGATRAAWVARVLEPRNLQDRPAQPVPPTAPVPRPPDIPPVTPKAQSWSRAPRTTVLPDSWVLLAYRGGVRVAEATSGLVREPLATGPDPGADPATLDALGADAGMRWMVDFQEAVAVGMGIRLRLTEATGRTFDQVLVLGVKATLSPADGAARLAHLLDAQHYTHGLALPAQGTPTNNTARLPAGATTRDPGHEASFRVERRGPLFARGDGRDGDLLAAALGIPAAVLAHVAGADGSDQQDARAMATVLWRATWGYFLEQLFEGIPEADIAVVRQHFVDHVRGRGPLPALRVGRQPYGVLPVTTLDGSTPGPEPGHARVVGLLQSLLPAWRAAVPRVPRIGRTGDPDRDLMEVLAVGSSSCRYVVRPLLGRRYTQLAWSLLGTDPGEEWWRAHDLLTGEPLDAVDAAANAGVLAEGAFGPRAVPFRGPLVQSGALSEVDPLRGVPVTGLGEAVNYLTWARRAGHAALDANGYPGERSSLLYKLVRHAVLLEYVVAGHRLKGVATVKLERQVLDLDPAKPDAPVWRPLENASVVTDNRPIGAFAHGVLAADVLTRATPLRPELREIGAVGEALARLEQRPTAVLERLLRETLDLAAGRLDAWITSYATKRLEEVRAALPDGTYLGAWGYVEGLRPAPKGESAGFVHAPSIAHASTAAVLLSGHRTHARGGSSPLQIDLSSRRVRIARKLLEGVQAGQPLGALLGYRFERALHEGHPGLRLDRFIRPFRELAPLVAHRREETRTGEPAESVAASNVVDGLRLHELWQDAAIPFGDAAHGLPAPGTREHEAVLDELQALHDAIDAVGDVALAEGVHQLVVGNAERAGAVFDAVSGGETPVSELDVTRTPRAGTGVTHRLLVLFSGSPPPVPAGWRGDARQARAAAEPWLDAWAGALLGDPDEIRCSVVFLGDDGNPLAPAEEIRMSELGLSPTDVVALAGAPAEVEERVAYRARRDRRPPGVPREARVRLDFGRGQGWPPSRRSFGEALEVARALADLASGSRPARASDLTGTETRATSGIDAVELEGRADAAVARLERLGDDLDAFVAAGAGAANLDVARDALLRAAHVGVPDTVPRVASNASANARETLFEQVKAAGKEVARRRRALADAPPPVPAGEARATRALARLHAVFGEGFTVLPRFGAGNPVELVRTFTDPALVPRADPGHAVAWFQKAARVRPGAARLDDVLLYRHALTGAAPAVHVGQVPFVAGDPWVGMPPPTGSSLPAGRVSLVAHAPVPLDPNGALAGLVVDEWVETVPSPVQTTGLTFHFDAPGARAPQAILLAVTPAARPRWDIGLLSSVVLEAVELAKLRAADLASVEGVGHYLPAMYFAHNLAGKTVSTDLLDAAEKAVVHFPGRG